MSPVCEGAVSPLFLFMLFGLAWILTDSFSCLVRGSLKYPHAFMLSEGSCPSWSLMQWLRNTESLVWLFSALRCFSPLVNIVLLVSPW